MEIITIALVAHDARKEEMVRFAVKHAHVLKKFNLVATRSTGEMIIEQRLEGYSAVKRSQEGINR